MENQEKNNPVQNNGLQNESVSSGTGKSEAALREEVILKFWKENKIFEKSLERSEDKKEFVFYEGPPTANGKPGIHHLEARAFKDAIPRYKTMRGYHVRRKGGWDTHGLPVELQVEKKLNLNSKKAIEDYGIAKFNQECKESVWEYLEVWNKFTKRIGYWLDQENPYVTYDNTYIESVWNVLSRVNDQNLLYKDYRVVPWCPRCGTALSSHELAQGYEEVKDLSVYVKFKIVGQDNAYFLAWTTTPWTLPGNVALAVGEDIDYVEIKLGEEILVLAKSRLSIISEPYEIVAEHKGKEMAGMQYEPIFLFLNDIVSKSGDTSEKSKLEKAFKIYTADFVNTEDGTGIVHTAVMYGQDDFALGTKIGLPKYHLVNLEGKFIKNTGFLEGRYVKEIDENGKPTLAVDIIDDLKKRNLFFKQENYKHSYPHCWRCKTALIYYARDSWYIRMSDPKIKKELIEQNKEINWEPSHIKDGRFGEWLKEIKDWAISRERYWGTPLPVWLAGDGEKIVVDSLDTLKKYSKKSGNKYFVMRHGSSEGNKKGVVSYKNEGNDHLTEDGKKEVEEAGELLKNKNIDYIVHSNFARARETAELVGQALGMSADRLINEPGLREVDPGEFDGKNWSEYHQHVLATGSGWFERKIGGGESFEDVKERTARVLYSLEEKYKYKNILLVTHGAPSWLLFVNAGLFEPKDKEYKPANTHAFVEEFKNFQNSEVRELPFVPIPHDQSYSLDLHRPYIDEIVLEKNGKEFLRTKEVMDVWFDSGAMPFAQEYYPFDLEGKPSSYGAGNKNLQKILYPADFISEAVDQTRGWFYTLHAIGTLMGRGKAYKNVICLGHLLDAKGKKMSKSLGNVVDPWVMIDKYGVDTLRLWMYSVNQPGESKNFDEKTVALLSNQVFGLLYNVLAFYGLYRDASLEDDTSHFKPVDILDRWILARQDELVKLVTTNLDNYKLLESTRAIKDFIGDLSTWYLRRSRDRIKSDDKEAKKTLYVVLKTTAKLLAPLAPFSAEDLWLRLKNDNDVASVHLALWPEVSKSFLDIFTESKSILLENMEQVRKVVSLGLEARQKAGIKVRQPLATLRFKSESGKLPNEYLELIRDELNVKEVIFDSSIENEVLLDINISEELKQEGNCRELVRALQDMRKELGLTPSDVVSIVVETSDEGQGLIEKFETELKKTVLVAKIEFGENEGGEIKVGDLVFKVKIGG